MHYDFPLTSSPVRVSTLLFVAVAAVIGVVIDVVVDRSSVGRNEFMRQDSSPKKISSTGSSIVGREMPKESLAPEGSKHSP